MKQKLLALLLALALSLSFTTVFAAEETITSETRHATIIYDYWGVEGAYSFNVFDPATSLPIVESYSYDELCYLSVGGVSWRDSVFFEIGDFRQY